MAVASAARRAHAAKAPADPAEASLYALTREG